jgi:hypothetical protein
MFAARTSGIGPGLDLIRTLGGLAAVVAPFAILVHLAVEALALGTTGSNEWFVKRHLYLVPMLIGCLWSFRETVGWGHGRAELKRRCALIRGRLRRADGRYRLCELLLANIAFFALTQFVEGTPIASGSLETLGLSILAALIGSLLVAFLVFRLGPALLATTLAAIAFVPERVALPTTFRIVWVRLSRSAATLFSLFRPKRPPPTFSLA